MIVSVIIAKGNSNRIPGKNKKSFCGHPLFTWTLEQCLCSKISEAVFVSTDDDEIKDMAWDHFHMIDKLIGRKKPPFVFDVIDRPYELTLTPANQAIIHAMNYIENKGIKIDHVITPLPTSPIRLPDDIDNMSIQHLQTCPEERTGSVCEQLETILYEPISNGKMKIITWAKHGEYYVDGGGMSINNNAFYRKWTAQDLRPTDKEYDQEIIDNINKGIFIEWFHYIMKEWQTPELDNSNHWNEAEAIMDTCILQPLGRDCYIKYFLQGENNG